MCDKMSFEKEIKMGVCVLPTTPTLSFTIT